MKPASSSIVLDIMPVLKSRNITNPFTYLIKLGLSSTSVSKILSGKSVQINYNQLTAICVHLNCTPNDVFVQRDMQLPDNHALHVLKKVDEIKEIISINDWLVGKTVEEVQALLKK